MAAVCRLVAGGCRLVAGGWWLVAAGGCRLQAGGCRLQADSTVYHGRWPLPLALPGTPAVGRCGGMAGCNMPGNSTGLG